jgi:hypothetical protein
MKHCIFCPGKPVAAVTWRCTAGRWARMRFPRLRASWLVTDPVCQDHLLTYLDAGYDVRRIWGLAPEDVGELTYRHKRVDGLAHYEAAALAVRMHDAVHS